MVCGDHLRVGSLLIFGTSAQHAGIIINVYCPSVERLGAMFRCVRGLVIGALFVDFAGICLLRIDFQIPRRSVAGPVR
jgi:hypothetical protein